MTLFLHILGASALVSVGFVMGAVWAEWFSRMDDEPEGEK